MEQNGGFSIATFDYRRISHFSGVKNALHFSARRKTGNPMIDELGSDDLKAENSEDGILNLKT